MHKIVNIIFAFILTGSVFGQEVKDFNYHLMLQKKLKHTVNEMDVKMASKDTSILFLDARETEEYTVSHIKNAVHVGYRKFSLDKLKNISKNKKIVVYCSVGYRSEKIATILKKNGYGNCYNLYGGIFEWVNENNIVYDGQNNITKKVHIYSSRWSVWLNKGEKIHN